VTPVRNRAARGEPNTGGHGLVTEGTSLYSLARENGYIAPGTVPSLEPKFDDARGCTIDFTNPRDGAVGPDGRFYAGSLNGQVLESSEGALWRLDHDGTYACIQNGLVLPNGISLSPDGRTMYVTEMWARRITAFDFDPRVGAVSRRRVLVTVPEEEGYPDGLIVDSDGFLWSAHWQGFRLTRYDPEGKKERQVAVPVPTATCMAFGGRDLDELFITTGKKGLSPDQLRDYPTAGVLYRIRPGVRARLEPEFIG
jgi:sugar lactone lactonase YvrE